MNMIENPVGPKIPSVLGSVSRQLNADHVPYALSGAMALSIYGLSRYTSDIDLMCDAAFWPAISQGMSTLGFECVQKTEAFAQFDAEGCSCIACANRRKALIYGSPGKWKFRL